VTSGWIPLGESALRAPRPPGVPAAALIVTLRERPGVVDVVVTDAWVAVTFVGAPPDLDADFRPAVPRPAREHTIAVRYDGPDLDEVAARVGLLPAEVAALHAAGRYEVLFVGFLPGFAYLGGLDVRLRLPRRASPRPRVPAGAVGIADGYTGVYPFASSGGWNLIGAAVGFRALEADGAALGAGDVVRFVPA
jgi:allophanate hydrolase subunit 1